MKENIMIADRLILNSNMLRVIFKVASLFKGF